VYNTRSEERNLPKWWNLGLWGARDILCCAKYFMVTESDIRMTWGNVQTLKNALVDYDFSLVGPNLYGALDDGDIVTYDDPTVLVREDARILQTWMGRTDEIFEADERYPWWYGERVQDLKHRTVRNGVGIIGAARYERPPRWDTHPDQIPGLQEIVEESRLLFESEWGTFGA